MNVKGLKAYSLKTGKRIKLHGNFQLVKPPFSIEVYDYTPDERDVLDIMKQNFPYRHDEITNPSGLYISLGKPSHTGPISYIFPAILLRKKIK